MERLDGPGASNGLIDPFRRALVGIEAGGQADDFDSWLFTVGSYNGAGELPDLLGCGPDGGQYHGGCDDLQLPPRNPTVAGVLLGVADRVLVPETTFGLGVSAGCFP